MVEVQHLVAIMGTRVAVLLCFTTMLFIQWFKTEKKSIRDFKFLFGLLFFFLACGKLFDIFFCFKMGELEVLTAPEYLPLLKLRWILIIANTIPLFSLLVFVWFYKSIKKQILFNGIFIVISSLLVIFAPSYVFLQGVFIVMLLPVMILSDITFFNLHRHKRLPQFHSLLMGVSLLLYLIMQILHPVLVATSFAQDINIIISEGIDLILWTLMGLSFVIKPRFTRIQTQKIIV